MDYNDTNVVIMAVIISNLVALLMLWCSVKKPVIARLLFFLLFAWAGITNTLTSLNRPEVYLEYAEFAWLPVYRDFILGYFSEHARLFVLCIAVCQLLVAISMLMQGNLFRMGCAGGILFLLAILPLGWGSGSPSPLIWAFGLWVLARKNSIRYLWHHLRKNPSPVSP